MKQKIKNYLLRSVVRVMVPDDVIRVKKDGSMMLGDKIMTENEKNSLKAEAKALASMRVWSIINESIKQLCYERGWRDSTSIDHLNTGKAMYSILETQASILERLSNSV